MNNGMMYDKNDDSASSLVALSVSIHRMNWISAQFCDSFVPGYSTVLFKYSNKRKHVKFVLHMHNSTVKSALHVSYKIGREQLQDVINKQYNYVCLSAMIRPLGLEESPNESSS